MRVEVRAALRAADWKPRQRVLVDLLERKELQDIERDARMEAQPAFVWADDTRHLHAEAAVHMALALVILPRDTEHDHAFRLDHAL